MTSPSSLIDRAGLDRGKVRQLIGRGLDGADDGELFLEYRQAEALTFDNGRLKQATYDTVQGFGLRAVKDEAVGYAHASDLSEARARRARPKRSAPSKAATAAPMPRRRRAPIASFIATKIRWAPGLRSQGQAARVDRRLCARERSRACGRYRPASRASWQVVEILRADGETYRDIRPMVRMNVSVVAGDGDRQESGSYGFGGREGFRAFHRTACLARRGRRSDAAGSGQSSRPFRLRPVRWMSCSARAGPA